MTDTAADDKPAGTSSGPRGRKPRRIFSLRNIMIYGTLLVVALYYLLPLYVMAVLR